MSDLKAVILCAGEGTRLRPLTFSRPKHLLPVAGKPLLGRSLDTIKTASIHQVALVVGHGAETVRRYVGTGDSWGLQVSYIVQQQPLGLSHAIACAQDFVGEQPFVVYLGDNLLEVGINDFVKNFITHRPEASLLLYEIDDPSKYGVAELDENGNLAKLVEKPAKPATNLAVVGVYAFNSSIFDAITAIQPSTRGEYEITDAIQLLVDNGHRVTTTILNGFWEDAGEPDALLRANRLYLDRLEAATKCELGPDCRLSGGPIYIGAGTMTRNVEIAGPCYIDDNCVLQDAIIGPYASLGEGCQVINTMVKDCVVQPGARLQGLRAGLVHSVLGEQAVVASNGDTSTPLHVILGDMAQVRVL